MVGVIVSLKRLLGMGGKVDQKSALSSTLVRSGHLPKEDNPNEITLSGIPYISLPRSPRTWELRREQSQDFYRAYNDPTKHVIFEAYRKKQYNKVVGLIASVPLSERNGEIGHTFLKAYRNLIQHWRTRDKPASALRWSTQMMENLPHLITDTDRRCHNKLITELESGGAKRKFTKVDVPKCSKRKEPRFSVSEGSGWILNEYGPIVEAAKPDPSFDTIHPTANGVLYFDTRGRSAQSPDANSAVQFRDQMGQTVAESGLAHDIYRLSVSPIGCGFAALSSDCGLYVYNDRLAAIFFRDLRDIGTKKNYIRCVDVSPGSDRILYTVVDQAWCVDYRGRTCWAVKLPPKEGWQKVVERLDTFGTSDEITQALNLIGLSFPFCAADVKKRYRELAIRWHPDKNPGDPLAHGRMQKLNNAYELLTGEKVTLEGKERERVYYKRVMQQESIEVPEAGVAFDLEMSMIGPGEDWIYSASLSDNGGGFLGSYSGKIVEINAMGEPIQFFDIGCTPEKVIEIHPYLYVLTSTRLYILENSNLLRLLDIFGQGDLMFTQTGFILIASKTLRWFNANGDSIGEINADDPIRRVYPTREGLIVETRQHRALIEGVPSWWRLIERENKHSQPILPT